MSKTSYRGQGSQGRGRGGHEGARQPQGGPQHQAHCPNTGRPKNDSDDRRPSDNDRCPNNNDCRLSDNDHRPNNNVRRQHGDGRNPIHARVDAEFRQVHAQLGPVQRLGPVRQRLGPVPPQGLIPNRKC